MKHVIAYTLLALACACAPKVQRQHTAKPVEASVYTYHIVAQYPHQRTSYTQGLQFVDGQMWEGTGEWGTSWLQKIDLSTGKSERIATLSHDQFGEGITLLGEKIYQLTWKSGIMHIYDRKSGKKIGEHRYRGEGWGLTTDGEMLYMSDGTDRIRIIDPATMEEKRYLHVTCNGQQLEYLNELEWIEGRIWANVYTTDQIVMIDPQNGVIDGVLDLTGILAPEDRYYDTDVLNGIAYDQQAKRIFVTGKNWSKLFEITIEKIR